MADAADAFDAEEQSRGDALSGGQENSHVSGRKRKILSPSQWQNGPTRKRTLNTESHSDPAQAQDASRFNQSFLILPTEQSALFPPIGHPG